MVKNGENQANHAWCKQLGWGFAVPVLAVLIGVCMIGYPFASDYLNKLEQAKVSQEHAQTISQTPKEDLSAYMRQAQEYNARLLSGATYIVDPFDPNAPDSDDAEYLSCLNLEGNGVMGQIVIPSISVNLPIYHGTEGEGMSHGVGHLATRPFRWVAPPRIRCLLVTLGCRRRSSSTNWNGYRTVTTL